MIREAFPEDFSAIMRVLESALLEIDPENVRESIGRGDVLVAVGPPHVRGALVLDGAHIEAVAVARTHRAKGIGSDLVERAAERGPLTADFRPAVCPFYESLGFEIECGKERCTGRLDGQE